MESHGQTQRETREIWGTEDGTTPGSHYPVSQARAGISGGRLERFSLGTTRAPGAWGGDADCILGGILSQLISQAEDQLREAEECISWYQRSAEKAQQQLENLKQLQQLADQETNAE